MPRCFAGRISSIGLQLDGVGFDRRMNPYGTKRNPRNPLIHRRLRGRCGRRDSNPHGAQAPTDFRLTAAFASCELDFLFVPTPVGTLPVKSLHLPFRAWLRVATSQGPLSLRSVIPAVAGRTLKTSPLRLPIPPRPHGSRQGCTINLRLRAGKPKPPYRRSRACSPRSGKKGTFLPNPRRVGLLPGNPARSLPDRPSQRKHAGIDSLPVRSGLRQKLDSTDSDAPSGLLSPTVVGLAALWTLPQDRVSTRSPRFSLQVLPDFLLSHGHLVGKGLVQKRKRLRDHYLRQ